VVLEELNPHLPILIGKKPFIINNIKSSKKPTCVRSFFLNFLSGVKKLKIVDEDTRDQMEFLLMQC
jgi:hypothetical protein